MENVQTVQNESKVRTKEELQRERERNRSLISVSRATKKSLGIFAVQKEDGIFQLRGGIYVKIYSFKTAYLGERKLDFIKQLCGITTNRIRLSVFCINTKQKNNAYMFMSVYFSASDYSTAYKQILEFDTKLKMLNVILSDCSIDNVMMYIHMNCAGEMKQYNHELLLAEKENWKNVLYDDITDSVGGEFQCHGQYGICLLGKLFPNHEVNLDTIVKEMDGSIQFIVDIQVPTDEERKMFLHEMGKKYCCSMDKSSLPFINLTYSCAALFDSWEKLKTAKDIMKEVYYKNDILMVPCCGRETEVFYSICSLGTLNFHSMKNVNIEFISSLLL